jgi:hypothetical protein
MTEEPRESSFDALAKGLASDSLSRRKALRLMGAALVGGALGTIGLQGEAQAAKRACVQGFTPFEPGTHCNVSNGVQLYCCSNARLITCCTAGQVCCIAKGSPQCVSSVENCKAIHGRQGEPVPPA